jgi:hypothetical protein
MKTALRLSVSVMLLLLTGWVSTPEVSAQVALDGSLAVSPYTTDVIAVICPVGTLDLRCSVADTGGVDGVSFGLCVDNKHGGSRCNTAPDGGLSPNTIVGSGPGAYEVKVFKAAPLGNTSAAGIETYRVHISCNGGATTAILVQNQ